MQNNFGRKVIRICSLLLVCMVAMGQENCDEKNGRVLKMNVDVGEVISPSFMVDGQDVDFPRLAKRLLYYKVLEHANFIPTQIENRGRFIDNLSSYDKELLLHYGFDLNSKVADPYECLHGAPQVRLDAEVLTFKVAYNGEFELGFGPGSIIESPIPGSAGIEVSAMKLDVVIQSVNPFTLKPLIADQADAYDFKFSAHLELAKFLEFGLFKSTDVAKHIGKGWNESLDGLVEKYTEQYSSQNSWNDVWEVPVMMVDDVDNDLFVAFAADQSHGIKLGDKFQVYNMNYKWEAGACDSRLKYRYPMPQKPVAELEVVSLGYNVTVAKNKPLSADHNIKPGAIVKILQLKQEQEE